MPSTMLSTVLVMYTLVPLACEYWLGSIMRGEISGGDTSLIDMSCGALLESVELTECVRERGGDKM